MVYCIYTQQHNFLGEIMNPELMAIAGARLTFDEMELRELAALNLSLATGNIAFLKEQTWFSKVEHMVDRDGRVHNLVQKALDIEISERTS